MLNSSHIKMLTLLFETFLEGKAVMLPATDTETGRQTAMLCNHSDGEVKPLLLIPTIEEAQENSDKYRPTYEPEQAQEAIEAASEASEEDKEKHHTIVDRQIYTALHHEGHKCKTAFALAIAREFLAPLRKRLHDSIAAIEAQEAIESLNQDDLSAHGVTVISTEFLAAAKQRPEKLN